MIHNILLSFILLISIFSCAQEIIVKPGVYTCPPASSAGSSIPVISGSAHDLAHLEVIANSISPGGRKKIKVPDEEEQLVLVNSGTLSVALNGTTYALSKGSIAMIMPGDKYSIENAGKETVSFFVMKYKSKLPVDASRGKTEGGSFVKDWNKLQFNPHDRGGVRPYFNRPTAMAKRFEMHVTTLNEGITSHPPHTHGAEEIILVLDGNVDMLIGEMNYKGKPGDLLFVTSNIPHSLKNDGAGQCTYFAFQWE